MVKPGRPAAAPFVRVPKGAGPPSTPLSSERAGPVRVPVQINASSAAQRAQLTLSHTPEHKTMADNKRKQAPKHTADMTPQLKRVKGTAKRKLDFAKELIVVDEDTRDTPSSPQPFSPLLTDSTYKQLIQDITQSQEDVNDGPDSFGQNGWSMVSTPQQGMGVISMPAIPDEQEVMTEEQQQVVTTLTSVDYNKIPVEVHQRCVNLNYSGSKKITISFDLRTQQVCVALRGDGGINTGFLRLSEDELSALISEKTHDQILPLFTDPTQTYPIGSLLVTSYDMKNSNYPTPLIMISRKTQDVTRSIVLNRQTLKQLHYTREAVLTCVSLLTDNARFIRAYFDQFTEEAMSYFQQKKLKHSDLIHMTYHQLMKEMEGAFEETIPILHAVYSQFAILQNSVVIALLREELRTVHFGFMKNHILKMLSEK